MGNQRALFSKVSWLPIFRRQKENLGQLPTYGQAI
jgi:hypothetical protein